MISSVLSSLLAIVPIFGLILAGWSAGKTQILGPNAGGELNRFVIWLAMPAMLFDIVAKAKWSELWQLDFIAVFGLTGLITMALVVSISVFKNGQNLTDAVIELSQRGIHGISHGTVDSGASVLTAHHNCCRYDNMRIFRYSDYSYRNRPKRGPEFGKYVY